jgi:hypothetical protein
MIKKTIKKLKIYKYYITIQKNDQKRMKGNTV